jgi:hypothetical protein
MCYVFVLRSEKRMTWENIRSPLRARSNGMKKLFLDFLGLLMVGDGVLTLIDPKRHCLLWEVGPKPCQELIDEFAEHPRIARVSGLLEIFLGIMISETQKPSL